MKNPFKHIKADALVLLVPLPAARENQAEAPMPAKSKISPRVKLFALAGSIAASFLAAPIVAQADDSAQARVGRTFIARHHLHSRGLGAGFNPSGQLENGPGRQPPRDAAAVRATPAPFFPNPTELTPPSNAVPSNFLLFLNSVSCTSAGNCVAVGLYTDPTGSSQPMIFTETDGVWSQGVEAALPANAATAAGNQNAELIGVTCTSAGNCVAVGTYTDANGNGQGLVVNQIDGAWAQGAELSPPANATTSPGSQFVFLNAVACYNAGNCAVTGGYIDNTGNYQGLVISETGGVWAQGVEITLPANAAPNPLAGPLNPAAGVVSMGEVFCFNPGNCVAGGQYTDTNQNSQPMIAIETDGVWAPAIELTLPANAATAEAAQNGFLANLVCFSRGNCSAGGGYNDINGNAVPMVLNQTHGVWAQGVELTLPANAATAPGAQSAYLNGFNCTSRGNCIAYSAYNDLNGNGQPLVITETGGVWAQGSEPPLPANAATAAGAQNANINGMSCTSPGVCVAVGQFTDNNGFQQPMAYSTVPTLSITDASLPEGRVGSDYRTRFFATGGTGRRNLTWSVSAGSLPAGLTLNAATGEIHGKPTASGASSFTIIVSDSGTTPGQQANAEFTILVSDHRDNK